MAIVATKIPIGFNKLRSSAWTQRNIDDNCLFFASDNADILNKVVATQLPNQVTGSSDFLTVTGSGLNARYRTPNTTPYKTADSDNVFWKSDASESTCDGNRLVGYDFPRVLVKYLNVAPYTILWIAILKPGVTVTNGMRNSFNLSIWWDNTLSLFGNWKGNRGVGKSAWGVESVISTMVAKLIGYWKFEEASGDAADALGTLTGTTSGITYNVTGKVNKAFQFVQASNSKVTITTINGVTVHSFTLWAKRNTQAAGRCFITPYGAYYGFWVVDNGDIQVVDNSGSAIATWSGIWTDKTSLHHIAIIVSVIGASGKAELYFDNISKGEKSCVTVAPTKLIIGAAGTSGYSFDGIIDDVKMFNSVLTPTEINEDFTNGTNGVALTLV
jgi:hypothetical protein